MCEQPLLRLDKVAPYMGAWIETINQLERTPELTSHPIWVRGLKQVNLIDNNRTQVVAPYMGAWIETCPPSLRGIPYGVAPYMGAWIETYTDAATFKAAMQSHPIWVRGLKHGDKDSNNK